MKKLLAVLALVALSGVYANAEDKGTEFKFGGEIRERFYMNNNPTYLSSNAMNETHFQQRNQFHVNAISGDKLQAYFNFLHYSIWGQMGSVGTNSSPYGAGAGVPAGTAVTTANSLQVGEAWLWWKVSDMFSTKAGRQAFAFGDGAVASKNDWGANPYNLEGIMGRFSWDFMDLDVGGAKIYDAGLAFTGTNGTDTELGTYLVHAGIKNLPDVLKTAEVFVWQINGDAGTGGGTIVPSATAARGGSWSLTSYGVSVKGDVAMVDYRGTAVFQSGKQKATAGDVTIGGNMFDVEGGFNFPEFMKGRVFGNFHMDTGNDGTSTTSDGTYQPLLYDTHTYSGGVNVIGWGNLTNIRFGATLMPGEDTWVGLEGDMFSRTKSTAGAVPSILGAAQGNFSSLSTNTTSADAGLGTQLMLWGKHNYGHGFSMLGQLGYFQLGNYFKPAGSSTGNFMQFVAQAQYNF